LVLTLGVVFFGRRNDDIVIAGPPGMLAVLGISLNRSNRIRRRFIAAPSQPRDFRETEMKKPARAGCR